MKIFCRRYMWTLKDKPGVVNFKIVTDMSEGLLSFENALISQCGDNLSHFAYEYLHEIECDDLAVVHSVLAANSLEDTDSVDMDRLNMEY